VGDGSKIQWTDATWNPATGCSHVSEGCEHCYAETLTRMKAKAGVWEAPDLPWTAENAEQNVILHPERLDQPLRWRKPRMVFVNSMSDLFHPQIPTSFLLKVFNVMDQAPRHTFQVLTKRPKRQRDFVSKLRRCRDCGCLKLKGSCPECGASADHLHPRLPLANVWLGTSIESREYVGRADLLRETPAAIRFISAEPLLGPLLVPGSKPVEQLGDTPVIWPDGYEGPDLDLSDIDWLIVGGESGDGHRPIDPQWVRDLRDAVIQDRGYPEQAIYVVNGTNFFFKQWGGRTAKAGGRELDGEAWDEMPPAATPAIAS